MIKWVDSMKIPNMYKMKDYFQNYIQTNIIQTKESGLSKHATKCFTKLGKDMGFYVRAPNNFRKLANDDPHQYPNDGGLLDIDLVWITDNPYHAQKDTMIYNFDNLEKAKSEICLALEFETAKTVKVNDDLLPLCDELWKLSFVMTRVKGLIYRTDTNEIDTHMENLRKVISNFGIQQQPNPEWRIFAINENDDTVIGKIIISLE